MKPTSFFSFAYVLGLAAVIWVATSAVGGHALVLIMTLVIGGVFTLGAWELKGQADQARHLGQALAQTEQAPADLDDWLAHLPEGWREAVRLRLLGDRVSPPAPILTPYLVGLLVMLGMLGTFLGMVVTLSGTAFALQSLTDIQGIRVAFAEPIQGLGLAFGASVAGVATSAMLGLMSTLTRRERLGVWRQLDARAQGAWQVFHRQHPWQRAWSQLQANTQALPELVEQMGRWMSQAQAMQTQFSAQSLAQQERHMSEMAQIHSTLAQRLEQSLSRHLGTSTEEIGTHLRALAQDTQWQVQENTRQTAEQLRALVQDTLAQVREGGRQTAEQLHALAHDTLGRLDGQAEHTHQTMIQAHGALLQSQQTQSQAHLDRVEAQLVQHLGQLGAALQTPLARLIEISSQAPQAAAEVIAELRQRINASMARDNELLAERAQLMAQLSQASQAFGRQVETQGEVMGDLAIQLRASALEVASLGEAFGEAVQSLHHNQEQTLTRLQQIEAALSQSMQRSDEQMAAYVAQAREVIELSVAAQQPMIESLDRVSRRLAPQETA